MSDCDRLVIVREPTNTVVIRSDPTTVTTDDTDQTVVSQETTNTVVLQDSPTNVVISASGPQGPPGPPGTGTDFYYLHTQDASSTSWVVDHGLGRKPNTEVLIGGERISIVRVDHTSLNQLIVTFGLPKTGEVICS